MAVFDHQQDAIVVSVVFDGPPEAGKTTSLRALAASLGREVYTPEEAAGRTVYFDWLEYVGGGFDGRPIRCQVVTVPGQQRWADRRRALLEQADVVVFVGDTAGPAWQGTRDRLHELRALLDALPGPPVGMVFQANKRDLPDAVPMARVREELGQIGWRVAVMESVAQLGVGIRETFVFAVRLALDRVRELQLAGSLRTGPPAWGGWQDALASMRSPARPWLTGAAGEVDTALRRMMADMAAPSPQSRAEPSGHDPRPPPPGADAPVGLIWPPIDGRVMLQEAAPATLQTYPASAGAWVAGLGQPWRIHSHAGAVYDLDDGRTALVEWARRHARCEGLLSRRRCIVLAAAGGDRWRLWQVVHAESCLRERLSEGSVGEQLDEAARRLGECGRLLLEAQRLAVEGAMPLTCSVDTIGIDDAGAPSYVAPMLPPDLAAPTEPLDGREGDLPIERASDELAQMAQCMTEGRREELRAWLRNGHPDRFDFPRGPALLTALIDKLRA